MAGQVSHAADAPPSRCTSRYGKPVQFARCNPVQLPDIEVRFVDIDAPMPDLPVSCWNYTASDGTHDASFRQCHTGELGGTLGFVVGKQAYTVILDVSSGCTRQPAGHWTPEWRGHAFFKGSLDAGKLDRIQTRWSAAESRCVARKGTTPS